MNTTKDISKLVALYFPNEIDSEKAFQDENEAMDTWMHFMDMLLCGLLIVREDRRRLPYQGIELDDTMMMHLLEPHKEENLECREEFIKVMTKLVQKTMRVTVNGELIPMGELLKNTQLNLCEFVVVLTAFSVEYNSKFRKIYAVLQENKEIGYPTMGLACDLYQMMDVLTLSMKNQLLNRNSVLNFLLLEQNQERERYPAMDRPLIMSRNVLEYLMDGAPTDFGNLTEYVQVVDWQSEKEPIFVHESEIHKIAVLLSGYTERERCQIICLWGTEGVGKHFVMEMASASCGVSMITVHGKQMLHCSDRERKKILKNIVVKALLENLLIYIDVFDFHKEEEYLQWEILSYLSQFTSQILVSTTEEVKGNIPGNCNLVSIKCSMPFTKEQKELWNYFGFKDRKNEKIIPLQKKVDIERLVNCYSLTPKRIKQALQMGRNECMTEGMEELPEYILTKHIRNMCKTDFKDNATLMNTGFTWSDLQLEKEAEDTLKNACNRLFYKDKVFSKWGFDKKMPYGKGLSILLYGPPGTGKTMAAQVLAAQMQLNIYRIDLSQISSKFIGETEKNIGTVFEAAKDSNAILFFDEADALFAKRTEVESSNDRHANVETAYLLQKIEEYEGVSILATNNAANFDNAFKRRISYIVQITAPDVETRKKLWKLAFPADTPLEKVRLDYYAEKFDLVGSNIRNIAVTAAFLAASENSSVKDEHIMKAIKEEYLKTGRIIFEGDMM